LQGKLRHWTSAGGTAHSATLLGALLHALKLTQPWEDATAGLAANATAVGSANNSTNAPSSSGGGTGGTGNSRRLQQARHLIQVCMLLQRQLLQMCCNASCQAPFSLT
jgi:hypothetical protein